MCPPPGSARTSAASPVGGRAAPRARRFLGGGSAAPHPGAAQRGVAGPRARTACRGRPRWRCCRCPSPPPAPSPLPSAAAAARCGRSWPLAASSSSAPGWCLCHPRRARLVIGLAALLSLLFSPPPLFFFFGGRFPAGARAAALVLRSSRLPPARRGCGGR